MHNPILKLFQTLFLTKEKPRTGWKIRGIDHGESIAEHTLGVVLFTLMATEDLAASERLRALEMAIAHDLPEAIIKDYTPADKVTTQQKRIEEELAMDFFTALWPGKMIQTLRDRLTEYNNNETTIAKLVHQADKLDALVQALRYRKIHPAAQKMEDFKDATFLNNPTLSNIRLAVLDEWDTTLTAVDYIFFVGGPGVGKGTQCKYLSMKTQVACISLGEILRYQGDNTKNPLSSFIKKSFEKHVPIPGVLAMWILKEEIRVAAHNQKTLIVLDGFPRSLEQLHAFQTEISRNFGTIYLQCPPQILAERLQVRALSSDRQDDTDEATRTLRATKFENDNKPLLEELQNYPLQTVDGSHKESDVAMEIENAIKGFDTER